MSNPKKTVPQEVTKGGIQHAVQGPNYQMKLMEWFACFGIVNDLNFKLGTEIKEAGKFDDLVYEVFGPNGHSRLTLLQAKVRSNKKVTLHTILFDKDFDIHKYFLSYEEVKKNYNEIENLVFATSNRMAFTQSNPQSKNKHNLYDSIKIIKVEGIDVLLKDIGDCFKISCDRNTEDGKKSFEALKSFLIARDLINLMFFNKPKNMYPLLKNYREFIMENLIDESTWEFRRDFINAPTQPVLNFGSIFEEIFTEMKNSLDKKITKDIQDIHKNNIWAYFKQNNKKSLLLDFFDDPTNKTPCTDSEADMDKNIIDFLNRSTFLTNATTESINSTISKKFREKGYEEKKIESYCMKIEKKIKDWVADLKNPNKPIYITNHDIKNCLESVDSSFDINSLDFLSKDIIKKHENIEFNLEMCSQFADELLKPECKLMCYVTPKTETFLIWLKIVQILKSEKVENALYLQSSSSADTIQKGLNNFTNYCVIEINKNHSHLSIEDFYKKLESDGSQRKLIIIIYDKELLGNQPSNCKLIEEKTVNCRELTESSLKKILEKQVEFQKRMVQLKDLVPEDLTHIDIKVSELINETKIGADVPIGSSNLNLYIHRKISRHVNIKTTILEDMKKMDFTDKVAFDEIEFKYLCLQFPNKNIHLLYRSTIKNIHSKFPDKIKSFEQNQTLKWIKTHNKISLLNRYIDKEISILDEEELISKKSSVKIVSDVPGMGKTLLFDHLCQTLKNKNPEQWTVKIDLNDYSSIFEDMPVEKLNDTECIKAIIFNDFMKLKHNLERFLSEYALSNLGNATLFFDGYDEVARDYKDQVLAIVKYLRQETKCLIYISTRPEYKQALEDEYGEISYSLIEFDEAEQKSHLTKFWKVKTAFEDQLLSNVADLVLKNSMQSISDKDRSLTGIPLITRLLGEFFWNKYLRTNESQDLIITKIQKEKLNLFSLFENFIDNLIERHLIEKSKLEGSNVRVKKIMKDQKFKLKELYTRYSFRYLFKNKSDLDTLPSQYSAELTDEDFENLLNCGLIVKSNDQFKFIHNTFPEHFVANEILKHVGEECYANFWLSKISEAEGYQTVRSFINHSISSHASSDNYKFYGNLILERNEQQFLALHIAAEEQNSEVFEFLLQSILSYSETHAPLIKKMISSEDETGYQMFHYYFKCCDAQINYFDELIEKFGSEFIKEILERSRTKDDIVLCFKNTESGFIKKNLANTGSRDSILLLAAKNGKNHLKLLEWILKNFKGKKDFLGEVLNTVDIDGNGLMHNSSLHENFENFLKILYLLKEKVDENKFIDCIKLKINNENENFLFTFLRSSKTSDITFVLNWLKKVIKDKIDLKNFVSESGRKDLTVLHYMAYFQNKKNLPSLISKFLSWISNEFGVNFVEEILLRKEKYGNSFLNVIINNDEDNYAPEALVKILNILKDEFKLKPESLKKLMSAQDDDGTSFLLYVTKFGNKQFLPSLISKFLLWISNEFGVKFVEEILMMKNNYRNSFLNLIIHEDEGNHAPEALVEILNFLKDELKMNPEFLKKLVLQRDSHGISFLHYVTQCGNKQFLPLLISKFLSWISNELGTEFVEELLIMKDNDGDSFWILFNFEDPENHGPEAFVKILNFLKYEIKINKEILREMFFGKHLDFLTLNNSTIKGFALFKVSLQQVSDFMITTLLWIKKEIGIEVVKKFLQIENYYGYLFWFANLCDESSVVDQLFNKLLREFGIDSTFFEQIIFDTDGKCNSFLEYILKYYNKHYLVQFLFGILKTVKKFFGSEKIQNILTANNSDGQNLVCLILSCHQEDYLTQLLLILTWIHQEVDSTLLSNLLLNLDNQYNSILQYLFNY